MHAEAGSQAPLTTLPFETFWGWLAKHPNCILRAGTPDAVLVDDEDLHWHFGSEGQSLYVQLLRGKRLLGEILVDPERVAYVQTTAEEQEGEFGFDLISEGERERLAAYFFVLSHAYDADSDDASSRTLH